MSELDPTTFYAPFFTGWTDIQAGKLAEAAVELRSAAAIPSAPPFVSAWLGFAFGTLGDRSKAMSTIEEIRKRSVHGYVPPFNLALVYLGLGDRSRAMDSLERAAETHSVWLPFLKMDKVFDPVRSEPRFMALMKKLGFED